MRKKHTQHNRLPDIQEDQETEVRAAFLDQGSPEQASRSAPVLMRVSGGRGASMGKREGARPGFKLLQRSYGNRATIRFMNNHAIQPKLNISQPGDVFEKEADQVAGQIIREPESMEERSEQQAVQSHSKQFQISPMGGGDEGPDRNSLTGSGPRNALEHHLSRQMNSGRPLERSLRAKMEPRFGYDFNDVRIHTGRESGRLNRALNARAFTYGRDIFFGEGEFSPNTSNGRGLIGHELTHVVQQQGNRHMPGTIQRDDLDAGLPAGVPMPEPVEETENELETLDQDYFYYPGDRYDTEYIPGEPSPNVGELNIIMYVHITYAPFTRSMMRQREFRLHRFTREQLRDFNWSEEERETFSSDFIQSVQDAWSERYYFRSNEPDFSEYCTSVHVNVVPVENRDRAHFRITAQKVPEGAPRLRSFVRQNERTATLDIRDPSEPSSTTDDRAPDIIVHIGPFGYDDYRLTPALISQVVSLANRLRPLQSSSDPNYLLGYPWAVDFIGRASSPGGPVYNHNLGLQRAQEVEQRMGIELNRPGIAPRTGSEGDTNTTEDERFQRVDVRVVNSERLFEEDRPTYTQNTAAHEAGHMFGLGDEYIEEDPPPDVLRKFEGDRPSHYDDVEELVGTDEAEEMVVRHTDSIMSTGSQVRPGHYVYFLQTLIEMTGISWEVEEP